MRMVLMLLLTALSVCGSAVSAQTTDDEWLLQNKDFRESFLRSFRLSCETKNRDLPENKVLGFSEQQIVDYCDCTASETIDRVTVSELKDWVSTKNWPPSVINKLTEVASLCGSKVLGVR
jgi:hypothetical protein